MRTSRSLRSPAIRIPVALIAFSIVLPFAHSMRAAAADPFIVATSKATGVARFVRLKNNTPLAVAPKPGNAATEPVDFFRVHGALFGVTDPDTQLVEVKRFVDPLGQTHTSFEQRHNGLPVFGAVLRVHTNAQKEVLAANGTFIPGIKIGTTPTLTAQKATEIAMRYARDYHDGRNDIAPAGQRLLIFRANLARGFPGRNHLAYEVEVVAGLAVKDFVYVDAHTGSVIDRISGIHEAIHRRTYDLDFGPTFLIWEEGDPQPFGAIDVDHIIDYARDTYNLYGSISGGAFLSWDGADGIMHSVNDAPLGCPNASWNGLSTNYCLGVTSDDVVAHEWSHAYTDSTHNLIYQWQSGALNEAYSDIFGETVDLLNADGTDAPAPPRADGDCSIHIPLPPVLTVNAPAAIAGTYSAGGAQFNPAPPFTVTAELEFAFDGDDEAGAASVNDGCQPLIGFTPGNIALIDLGACPSTDKVTNAADAGAAGVILVNLLSDSAFPVGGGGTFAIPSVVIGLTDGDTFKAELPGVNATITLQGGTADSYRWLIGEDSTSFGGPIRDMWNPNCADLPAKVSDPFYFCGTGDAGGVHFNSSIPNHAFALLVDGGSYNGQTIAPIGMTKATRIYWRAQSVYQVPASGFADHADALEASCTDLIGASLNELSTESATTGISPESIAQIDCDQVAAVVIAVEMRADPAQCAFAPLLSPIIPARCDAPGTAAVTIFSETWEQGLGAWTVGTRDVADPVTFDTPDWAVVSQLPDGRNGVAAFVADLTIGNCADDLETGVLYLESPLVTLSTDVNMPRLAFDHWVATEPGWDGGNVKISVNAGPFTLVPASAFVHNAYNTVLIDPVSNTNPIAGEAAFSGTDGGSVGGSWGRSIIDLSQIVSPGDTMRIRFEFGLDGCNGRLGWYIDDVVAYDCVAGAIPTLSEWALVILTLLTLTAGTRIWGQSAFSC